jgi:zinc transport system permease protein
MEFFLVKLFIASVLLAILLGLYSFIVFFFRLSFLTIAVSHAVLAGLALGIFLKINPTISALIFSIVIGWFIGFLKKKTHLTEDASIGVVLALSMALGIIGLYLSNYQGNIFSYLFGSILLVDNSDIFILAILLVISLILWRKYSQQILFMCFDEETAYASGIDTSRLYYGLTAFLSVLITYLTKVIGVILAHAMLVIPTATAYQIFWNYKLVIPFSCFISTFSLIVGLFFSYFFDLPSGPAIVLIGGIAFFFFYFINIFRRIQFTKNKNHQTQNQPPK